MERSSRMSKERNTISVPVIIEETWADREIMLAIAKEMQLAKEDGDEKTSEFKIRCYEAALKAYNSLLLDDRKGFDCIFSVSKKVLDRLLDHKPLTPIHEEDANWGEPWKKDENGDQCAQSERYSALFKTTHADGSLEYDDVDRCYSHERLSGDSFHCGFDRKVLNDIDPITFPYQPYNHPIMMDVEEFDFEDNSYRAVYMAVYPDGKVTEINRFVRTTEENIKPVYEDITEKAYGEVFDAAFKTNG